MPFTFSHPAAIIPLRYIGKKYFSISGLIAGSIVPDFEYFLRIENRSRYSHTLVGVVWFDIPLALILCLLFHNVVKGPLIVNLPFMLQERFTRFYDFNWNRFLRKNAMPVLYSILIGVFSHIISDRITHKSSNIVSTVPLIMENQEIIENPKSIYRVIQITYSIIGIALCMFTVWQLPVSKTIHYNRPDIRYWLLLFCTFLVILSLIILRKGANRVDIIIGPISAMIAAVFATSLIYMPGKRLVMAKRYEV